MTRRGGRRAARLAGLAVLCLPALSLAAQRAVIDGVTDDLLTGGLGLDGLRAAVPGFADPRHPTAAELRRRAIWNNYRALVDLAPGGGAGELFGPRAGERIAGIEYLASASAGAAAGDHSVLLQIPARFDPQRPCLVVVASSGSRGIYGALPTAGAWGLRQGCAVVHTDKGTGTGFYDVDRGAAPGVDGISASTPVAGSGAFAPPGSTALAALRIAAPHALLTRHSHSGVNVEAHWGDDLIDAARLAFKWLNQEFASQRARPLAPQNTLVIASGISNGGAAVLRALERDRGPRAQRWFDAAVVAEPNVSVWGHMSRLQVDDGSAIHDLQLRPLLEIATLHALLQPCAVLAQPDAVQPVLPGTAQHDAATAWCTDLARAGDVDGATSAAQAADARTRLLAAGLRHEALRLGPTSVQARLWASLAVTYVSAYARLQPAESLCGFAFAAVDGDGRPRALSDEEWARIFSDSNGIVPTAGVALVRDAGDGDGRSASAANAPAAMRCLRRLVTEAGPASPLAARIAAGVRETALRGAPGDRPVIVLHGRSDGLIAVDHSSRAWYAAALGAGQAGKDRGQDRGEDRSTGRGLRYYEITHAQHFDAFLGAAPFAVNYVPMQPYLLAAMDDMYRHLRYGAPLAPSQVVRSTPRRLAASGVAEALTATHLGAWHARPPATERIEMRGSVLRVPE